MSKCLVTGGAGFVGSHVVDLLVQNGHEVSVIDNFTTGKKENLNPKAEFRYADIINREMCDASVSGKDYVFHLAALPRIQPSILDPVPAHQTNVNGTLNILEAARKHEAKVIYSGSSSTYDTPPTKGTNESHTKKPKSPYSLQKLIGDMYTLLYNDLYGMNNVVLRYFNVYGERQILEGAYAAVIGVFLDQYRRHQNLTITGDGEQRRDFTYVKDVARANVMAMDWKGEFNIGTGKNYSINEIAEVIPTFKKHIEARPGEAQATLSDSSKARAKGWSPKGDVIKWIKSQL